MTRSRLLRLLLILPLLAGCATRVPLDRDAAQRVQRVAVVTPAVPDGPSAPIVLTPGLAFGLVGALVDVSMQAGREQMLREALEARGYSARDRLAEHLAMALRAAGYAADVVTVERAGTDFLERYPETPADAVLDVRIMQYGYIARTPVTPFRPHAAVGMRLAAKDARPLLQDAMTMNWGNDNILGEDVTGPAGHEIGTSGGFAEAPERVAAGVDAGLAAMARQIVARLR